MTYEKRKCNHCKEDLEIGVNWSSSMSKRYDYKCLKCRSILDRPYELGRKRLARPDNERKRQYKKDNPHKVLANNAKRRAYKLNQTPAYYDHEAALVIYKQAANLNKIHGKRAFHVDHIIPLKGKKVSGLHVHTNLQILSAKDNISKGNKLIEELL